MPIQMKSVVHGAADTIITLYTRAEIIQSFQQFRYLHKADIKGERPYIICQADCLGEALVLTALMIRVTGIGPACFYYDRKKGKLYACCDVMGFSEVFLKRSFIKIIHRYTTHVVLKHLTVDATGNPLFDNPLPLPAEKVTPKPISFPEDAADKFHTERNFPFNTGRTIFPIHSRLTSKVLKDVFNPSDMEIV
jgi:hypothetical protein